MAAACAYLASDAAAADHRRGPERQRRRRHVLSGSTHAADRPVPGHLRGHEGLPGPPQDRAVRARHARGDRAPLRQRLLLPDLRVHAQRQRSDACRLVLPPRPRPGARRPSTRCRWSCSTAPRSAWTSPTFKPQTDITAADLDRVASESPVDVRPGDMCCSTPPPTTGTPGDKRYLSEFPGLGESASEWIVSTAVKTFGVDCPTPDNPASTSYPVPHDVPARAHHPLREPGQPGQGGEHPVHLRRVPAQAQGAHGGPTRAVAIVS